MATTTVRSAPSTALLVIALQAVAVGAMTLIAGVSNETATVMLIMMAGFWLIYGITEGAALSRFGAGVSLLAQDPSGKPENYAYSPTQGLIDISPAG